MAEAIKHTPERFQENLRRYNQKNGYHLQLPELKEWEFCSTGENKDLNLKKKGETSYLHFNEDVEMEIRFWTSQLNLDNVELLIVFGVGLGYHYQELLSWLQAKERRYIAFVEDDPELLRAFLETDAASRLLEDQKAELIFWNDSVSNQPFLRKFALLYHEFLPTGYKAKAAAQNAAKIKFIMEFFFHAEAQSMSEYLQGGQTYLRNYAENMLHLDKMLYTPRLFGKFKGIPAVICGAGPSLAKNIEVLKTLSNRALIFAGGTSVNALNVFGMNPHFGVGLDPYVAQLSRILENKAYLVPYIIKPRMHAPSVNALLGDLLYLGGVDGYPIAAWFEEKLGFPKEENVDTGANVVNFSLALAEKLGCNPIICVGLDLAYTNGLSYSPGVQVHASFDPKSTLITKSSKVEMVLVKDLEQKPIYTLQKWIFESTWYGEFAARYPHLQIYNCTEGGIGLGGIPNMTLQEAKERFLNKELNITDRVQAALKEAASFKMPDEGKVRTLIEELFAGVEKALQCTTEEELDKAMSEDEGLRILLQPFNNLFQGKQWEKCDVPGLPPRKEFLKAVLALSREALQEVLSRKAVVHEKRVPVLLKGDSRHKYREYYYPDGSLRALLPYLGEALDGSVQIFYPDGQLKRKVDYIDGKRHGEDLYYGANGKILAIAHYFEERPYGVSETFSSEGIVQKEIRYYSPGQIHTVTFFDPAGKPLNQTTEVSDYYEILVMKSVKLQETLQLLFRQLEKTALHSGKKDQEMIEELKVELRHLSELSKSMELETGLKPGSYKEPLWQSPLTQNYLEKFTEKTAETLSFGVASIEKKLKELLDRLKKE